MSLPIYGVIPEIVSSLTEQTRLVLQAAPGAGKTTVVPLELLAEPWLEDKKIIVLEPRRLAAITSARRMAQTLGERVGQRVGYRVRLDTKVSEQTRIEVVTEGIFIRMIQEDPELNGIGAVLFDEFHERSLLSDLALALTLDVQEGLRDDLRIILMSATLDGERFSKALNASLIESEGKTFPVELFWEPPRDNEYDVDHVVRIVRTAIGRHEGSVLVFLPGAGEIRRVQELLQESHLPEEYVIAPLFGTLSPREQELAINPMNDGKKKIVLATNIAETSLTIEGVTVVIDSGTAREPRYNPGSGMTRLVTAPISQASAVQRAGRAGRTAPGVCYRLWSETSHTGRIPFQHPEMVQAELSTFRLELALWGCDVSDLFFFDSPAESSLTEAEKLLVQLGALDENGRITERGRTISDLGVHPRLGAVITAATALGNSRLGCELAALLSERDFLRFRDRSELSDIALRLDAIGQYRKRGVVKGIGTCDRGAVRRIVELASALEKRCGTHSNDESVAPGRVLAAGFPDRIGLVRKGQTFRYLLSGGNGAHLPEGDPLSRAELIVVPVCAAREKDAKIFLAAQLSRSDVEEQFQSELTPQSELFWESREKRVVARDVVRLGAILFSEKRSETIDQSKVAAAVIEGIREMGLQSLPWNRDSQSLLERLRFIHAIHPDQWPDCSESALEETLDQWLAPFLITITRADQFGQIDLIGALKALLPWEKQQELDREVPEKMKVPEGTMIRIDYSQNPPVLAVKLQMMFGAVETPTVAGVPLVVHLLSPAGRPLQITQDLEGFWEGSYESVKKEMKGRYPKHPWPDNPREAIATAKTKRHLT